MPVRVLEFLRTALLRIESLFAGRPALGGADLNITHYSGVGSLHIAISLALTAEFLQFLVLVGVTPLSSFLLSVTGLFIFYKRWAFCGGAIHIHRAQGVGSLSLISLALFFPPFSAFDLVSVCTDIFPSLQRGTGFLSNDWWIAFCGGAYILHRFIDKAYPLQPSRSAVGLFLSFLDLEDTTADTVHLQCGIRSHLEAWWTAFCGGALYLHRYCGVGSPSFSFSLAQLVIFRPSRIFHNLILESAISATTLILRRILWWHLLVFWTLVPSLLTAHPYFQYNILGNTLRQPGSTTGTGDCAPPVGGKSGPKSGRSRRRHVFIVFAFVCISNMLFGNWSGGEGGGLTTETSEASEPWMNALINRSDAKQRGVQPPIGLGHDNSGETAVKKRSLKRACRRAQRDGVCWYRGKCLTVADFPRHCQQALTPPALSQPKLQRPAEPQDQQICNRAQQNKRYMRYMHWNGGGLSSPKLDELKLWAHNQNIDVLALTETRWRWNNEWQDDKWLHVHTGSPADAGAGILVLISRRICHPSSLRWHEVSPGRLLHVQIRTQPRIFDVLVGYQHAMSHANTRLTIRKSWWHQLDQYLSTLPKRNVLLMLGDFNCRLPESKGHVGPDTFAWRGSWCTGTTHPDERDFLALIRAHGLTALNTWHPQRGPTYHHAMTCSRIDFSFTRLNFADGCAKDVQILPQAPFMGSMYTGHFPLIGQIRKFWIPSPVNANTAGISPHQRSSGRVAYASNSAVWQEFMDKSGPQIERCFSQMSPHDPQLIPMLHRIASETFVDIFSCLPTSRALHEHGPDSARLMDKWRHRRACHKLTLPHMRNVFLAWFHIARFEAVGRQHKHHAYLVCKQKFEDVMQAAKRAADKHDSFQLFQTVNRFAPKQPRRKMQLRNAVGSLATPLKRWQF